MRVNGETGFTLVEIVVALGIFSIALVAMLYVAVAAQRLARAQADASDLQQRVRVVADRLQRDLTLAGAGPLHGSLPRTLAAFIAPIVPARTGLRLADAELSAFPDRLSVFYVPDGGAAASLVVRMPSPESGLLLNTSAPGCGGAGLCGFTPGTRALILDPRGVGAGHDVFTVTDVAGELAHGVPNRLFSRAYAAGDVVLPVVQRVYYLDRTSRRLMLYDGHQSDLPLVDNVVDLKFEYFGDASPRSIVRPPDGQSSCVFEAGAPPVPLLSDLGGSGLRQLTLAQLTDGPICGTGPNSFDGDLLRVRLIRVTLRMQASADDVRGSGGLFSWPGRSTSGYSFVPDYEITFDVTPRNLAPSVEEP